MEGYYYHTPLKDLLYKNKRPHKFIKSNPYTIQNMKTYLKTNGIGTELISENYISNVSKLKWKCSCGNEFETSWTGFCNGKVFCDSCSLEKRASSRRTEIHVLRNEVEKRGYKLIKTEYKSIYHEYIEVEDKFGYKYCALFQSLCNGYNPSKFYNTNKFTIYNINRWLNSINLFDYVCVDKEYKNNSTKMNFIHLSCGTRFKISLAKLQRKISETGDLICPSCYKRKTESYHASVLKQIFIHEYHNTVVEDRSCINPHTGYALPTDIVCYDTKTVIEIQSSFHDRAYKKETDKIKKNYWESHGFNFYAPDIRNYSIIQMVQLFFDEINHIPEYVDLNYNKCPNYKELQSLLDSGLSTKELSKVTGINYNNINSYIHKGLLKLPDDYKEHILNHRKIVQLTKDFKLINTFNSLAEADRHGYKFGTIRRVLIKKQKYSYGYIWMYESDYKNLKIA